MSTKRQSTGRSIIFWVFFLGSVPIAVLLISYASGFRFDRDTGTVIERAALSIETTPRDARISVSGTELDKKTPIVHSLSPGMYTLRIEKDGYQPWEKEVTVRRGESELFSDILLFSQETPIASSTQLTKTAFEDMTVDGRVLRALDGPEVLLVDSRHETSFVVTSREERETQHRIDAAVTAAEWNKDVLLYATPNGLWTYTKNGQAQLLRRQSLRILDVAWHPDSAYVFYSDLTGIYALELDSRDSRQRWKIADVTDASGLVVSGDGSELQFTSQEQIYSLQLY